MMPVEYEWVLEEVDQFGDVIACDYCATLAEVLDGLNNVRWNSLALVRSTFDARNGGMTDRQYAYAGAGTLPAEFDGGAIVPKRFAAELRSAADRAMRVLRA